MSMNSPCQTKRDDVILPDYHESSVNLVNSLLAYYGCATYHPGLKVVDELLAESYRHVFLVVLDGMGSCIIRKNLAEHSFLRTHRLFDYSAVYPCTTVAATTCLQTGRTPLENGWIGWHQYFPDLDEDIVLFNNTINATGEKYEGVNASATYLPYEHICDLIAKQGIATSQIYPDFIPGGAKDFPEVCQRIAAISQRDAATFAYVYWAEPDETMHKKGCYAKETKAVLEDIDKNLRLLSEKLPADTLLLITPDHGMHDVTEVYLEDYPQLTACFYRPPTVEPRCNSFYVKEESRQAFCERFSQDFPDFLLLTKQELLDNRLFGPGQPHPLLDGMLGEYFGIATGGRIISHAHNRRFVFKAHHAGLTGDEMIIPLVVFSGRERTCG